MSPHRTTFVEDVSPAEETDHLLSSRAEDTKTVECRLVRKLDMRLLPTVVIIYLMNYIDRAAISAARLQGLEADLGLTDVEYETVIAVLYAAYCPAQIPSNMIIDYMSRPSFYIASCVVAWGLSSAATGATKDFAGVVVCRIFIGLFEAAFYPGSIYLLSRWYTKDELSLRSAIFYVGVFMSNAFGSLIAAGILGLGGLQGMFGIAAWRWLFYIEGFITMLVGLASALLLPDFVSVKKNWPHNTQWLSPAERHLAQARLAKDTGEADKDPSDATIFDGFKLAICDIKVWIFITIGYFQFMGLSFVNFFPTLTATLGYDTVITLLIAAPPWMFAAVCCVVNAWHCDRTGERFFHIVGWWWVTIVGYVIALMTMSTGARYFSLFVMATGFCGTALLLNWVSNTISRPPAKRSVAIGLVNGIANLGNLMGSYTWKAKWGPEYHPSMIIALCSLLVASVTSWILRQMLRRENERMEREEREFIQIGGSELERIEDAARLEGISIDEAIRRRKRFRYLY